MRVNQPKNELLKSRNLIIKLDMSTAHRRLKLPLSPSVTSARPTCHTSQYHCHHGWLTPFSFHVNRPPHSWDEAISDSDLETPRSRSWVWSKGKVIHLAQYLINSLPFISHQSDQQFLRYSYFEILPRNIQGQGQRSRSHIISSVQPMHYLFV